MDKNCFRKRKRKIVVNISDVAVPTSSKVEYLKPVEAHGFTKENVLTKVKAMEKNPPGGNWRKTKVCKISYTYLIQKWVYETKFY